MNTRPIGRYLPAALTCIFAGLLLAVTPSLAGASQIASSGGSIVYLAQPDEELELSVVKAGSEYRFTDFGTEIVDIDGSGGCATHGSDPVTCPVAGVGSITVVGGPQDDSVTIDETVAITVQAYLRDGNDTALGGSGADSFYGEGDKDYLSGNAGDDLLTGGADKDTIVGGGGANTASYAERSTDVTVDLSLPGSQPQQDGDTLFLVQNVNGGAGNDTLAGSATGNVIRGGAGNDTLRGNAGVDWLLGGAGNDAFNGGADIDIELGETGNDTYGINPPDPGADVMLDEALPASPGGGTNVFLAFGDSAVDTIGCATPTGGSNVDIVYASTADTLVDAGLCEGVARLGN